MSRAVVLAAPLMLLQLCGAACSSSDHTTEEKSGQPGTPPDTSATAATAPAGATTPSLDVSAHRAVRAASIAARSKPLDAGAVHPQQARELIKNAVDRLAKLTREACKCRSQSCAASLVVRYEELYTQVQTSARTTPLTAKQTRSVAKQSKEATQCLLRAGVESNKLVKIFRKNSFEEELADTPGQIEALGVRVCACREPQCVTDGIANLGAILGARRTKLSPSETARIRNAKRRMSACLVKHRLSSPRIRAVFR